MSLIQYPEKLFSFLFIEIQWIFQNKLSKHNNQYKQKFSVTTHNQEDQISFSKKKKRKKKEKGRPNFYMENPSPRREKLWDLVQ